MPEYAFGIKSFLESFIYGELKSLGTKVKTSLTFPGNTSLFRNEQGLIKNFPEFEFAFCLEADVKQSGETETPVYYAEMVEQLRRLPLRVQEKIQLIHCNDAQFLCHNRTPLDLIYPDFFGGPNRGFWKKFFSYDGPPGEEEAIFFRRVISETYFRNLSANGLLVVNYSARSFGRERNMVYKLKGIINQTAHILRQEKIQDSAFIEHPGLFQAGKIIYPSKGHRPPQHLVFYSKDPKFTINLKKNIWEPLREIYSLIPDYHNNIMRINERSLSKSESVSLLNPRLYSRVMDQFPKVSEASQPLLEKNPEIPFFHFLIKRDLSDQEISRNLDGIKESRIKEVRKHMTSIMEG